MTAVGLDIKLEATYGPPPWPDLFAAFDNIKDLGLDGVNVRTLYEVSPTLDPGYLREIRARADELGLYLELGVGKVNPYMTGEFPYIRALGDGSYLAGMQKLIAAAGAIGVTNLWSATGGFKPELPGYFSTDRFRTDTSWPQQLAATEKFLKLLAPTLREYGCRLNLETHEEITTYELVRLVEAVGPDVLGICFDSANVFVRGEDAVQAARRAAPYVHSTQLRDAALVVTDDGISRFLAPIGEGVIDWQPVLDALLGANPDLNLTIEPIGVIRAEMTLHPYDPVWLAGHPDLDAGELAQIYRLAHAYDGLSLRTLRTPDPGFTFDVFATRSADALRTLLSKESA
ncbi:sugar phosphate isomerase/epimerase [Actinoplanes lutulentus]|uniref:Sugar phosphate isomerase/epimerase n=1 Tax=Actinoplanes lutulentus TaxID=1287878 RepID=A0A327ZC12_9ACTN|nr:sugar phosphate isomerase/epimerase family protein [Actinoplanes lutulentus]RAK36495.1 sugar phosphate isomerase/epimerase [Actinoplanes lutulentus]